jgi:hypothetical protein
VFDAATRTIGGLEFEPDFVWLKDRSDTNWNRLQNSVVGANKLLYSNSTNAEATDESNGHVNAFTTDGFIVDDASGTAVNGNGNNFVAWCWKAGGAAVSNTDGSITTSVSVNQEAGFSIVSWTGTNGTGTIGHGLGKTPKWVVIRRRNSQSSWVVYHNSIGNTKRITLDTTNDADGDNSAWFNNTSPTSTTVSLGADGGSNGSTDNYIAWCWAEIPGYSKFGEYIGNGSSDGPYVHLGFKPAFIIYKKSEGGSDNWEMQNTTIDTDNPVNESMYPNTSGAQSTGRNVDFLSNGFKMRNANGNTNEGSSFTYIYMAWAKAVQELSARLDAAGL